MPVPQSERQHQSIRYLFKKKTMNSYKDLKKRLIYDFSTLRKIAVTNIFRYFCSRQKRMKKWFSKVESTMQKELELTKFIHFKRVTQTAMLALLNGP